MKARYFAHRQHDAFRKSIIIASRGYFAFMRSPKMARRRRIADSFHSRDRYFAVDEITPKRCGGFEAGGGFGLCATDFADDFLYFSRKAHYYAAASLPNAIERQVSASGRLSVARARR